MQIYYFDPEIIFFNQEDAFMLREKLVEIALEWQNKYGVAPSITPSISEYDAAILVGMSQKEYSDFMQGMTAVNKGFDFIYKGIRYQIKANRPSGKPNSDVSRVPKAKNYNFDILIWILYNKNYEIQEAWEWSVKDYIQAFDNKERLSPDDMRKGKKIVQIIKQIETYNESSNTHKIINLNKTHSEGKDTTEYSFDGYHFYGKCALPYEIVRHYVETHPDITLTDLKRAFPDGEKICGVKIFIKNINDVTEKERLNPKYKDLRNPIILSSGEKIVISNQYNPYRIDYFKKVANKLGYKIMERK